MSGSESSEACVTCGAMRVEKYCPNCGEKNGGVDRSLAGLVVHAFASITNLENRFWSTLWNLARRPGKLSFDTARGSRVHALGIFQCFVILNAFYFLAPDSIRPGIFTTHLTTQLYGLPHSDLVRPFVLDVLASRGTTVSEFAAPYHAFVASWSKLLVILNVPLLALVLWLLYPRRRRYFVEHTWFALEFWSYFLIYVSIGGQRDHGPHRVRHLGGQPRGLRLVRPLPEPERRVDRDPLGHRVLHTVVSTPRFAGFYGDRRWSALVRALLVTASLALCVMLYRAFLLGAALVFA